MESRSSQALPSFWIEYGQQTGSTHRVRLHGELDIAFAPEAEAWLVALAGSTVEVDLSPLSFIDVRGMRALISAKRRIEEAGHGLRIVGATGLVRRVFTLLDLDSVLDD